jgi:hypothetical protein
MAAACAPLQVHRVKTAGLGPVVIGDWKIGVLAVDRRAPLHSAVRAAFAGAILPQHFAFVVRIHGET